MFDLRQPCVTCPFRKGKGDLFRLSPARLEEIRTAVAFQCHKTVDYDEEAQVDGDWDETWRPVKNDDHAQQCAGLMSVLHREGTPNQIMQIAERISDFDPSLLDPKNEAYGSWAEVVEAHRG